MIISRCYKCCHEKICNYKQRFTNAVEEVFNTSYPTGNGKVELLKDSAIVVELKCPHFMSENGSEQNAR